MPSPSKHSDDFRGFRPARPWPEMVEARWGVALGQVMHRPPLRPEPGLARLASSRTGPAPDTVEPAPAATNEGGPLVPEPWMSADEIATHLGITEETVYAWIAGRGMPAPEIGRPWRFQAGEAGTWVRTGAAATVDESGSG